MLFSSRRKKPSVLKRAIRASFAIIILSAFVLGVTFFVREVSHPEDSKLVRLAEPVSSKVGLDADDIGEVAGEFIERFSQTGIVSESGASDSSDSNVDASDSKKSDDAAKVVAKIALFADSEDDSDKLKDAVDLAEEESVGYIIHLGDLTAWGDVSSLNDAKNILNKSDVPWYAIPGDHDLGESVGRDNFVSVFGETYGKVEVGGQTIVYFDNSANFTPLDEGSFTWILNQISTADFILFSQPLYHPSNLRVMGIFEGEEQTDVLNQAKILLSKIRNSDVKAVIGADHHTSGKYTDPENAGLTHYLVGAISSDRNLQTPRFSMLTLYEDGTFDIEDFKL